MSKKILLISDNHGYCDDAILHHAQNADEVWHAGDWLNVELYDKIIGLSIPVRGVWGNADGAELRKIFSEHNAFTVEGLRVFMTHIGGTPGKYNPKIKPFLHKHNPDLFVCGHSHILRIVRDPEIKNMLYFNPGACGLQGFHLVRTAIRFQVENGKVLQPEVIEFGRRNQLSQ